MTQTWHTRSLLDAVARLHGAERLAAIRPPLSAVPWKLALAEYHSAEAKAVIAKNLPELAPDEVVPAIHMLLLQAAGDRDAAPFVEAQVISEAHVIAAAQALNSIGDILSHVVYFALDLDLPPNTPICTRYRSLHSVEMALKATGCAPTVLQAIRDFSSSIEFRYLRAYVNTTKHRSLVDMRFALDIESRPRRGIRIEGFTYDSNGEPQHWERRWADDFLTDTLALTRRAVVAIGCALNEHVENRVV